MIALAIRVPSRHLTAMFLNKATSRAVKQAAQGTNTIAHFNGPITSKLLQELASRSPEPLRPLATRTVRRAPGVVVGGVVVRTG